VHREHRRLFPNLFIGNAADGQQAVGCGDPERRATGSRSEKTIA
jgi:hypothetical protein